jgi:Fic family protein/plasmid maintenance system antidote protein VapI
VESFGFMLKKIRIEKKLNAKDAAQFLRVDSSYISKIENDKRIPTEEQVLLLADLYNYSKEELLKIWLSKKIINELKGYSFAQEVIESIAAEAPFEYIRNTAKNYSEQLNGILQEIDLLKSKLDLARSRNNPKIVDALKMEYIYESNRIEGNTLTLQETDLVINHGITIGGKSVNEHLEAINHSDAIDYIKELVQKETEINEREILSIHSLILRGINTKEAGRYRNVEVMISGSTHMPPSWIHLKDEMKELMSYYTRNTSIHPVVLAAEMHYRLVSIHPFIDGNGRTSRLLMNAILLRSGYVIANIKGDITNRLEYYKALEQARLTNNNEVFIEFVARNEKECLERYLKLIGA